MIHSFLQAAATFEEIAPPMQVVQIERLAVLKIIKHCNEFLPALVTGQLLGLDVGSVLEVTNCFPFPIREEDEEIEADGANYQLEMMRCLREVNVDYNTVGWYQSTLMGSFQTVELIETFMNYQENIRRCVCIIYDPSRSAQGVLALKALKLTDSFMGLYRNNNFIGEKLREKNLSWVDIFEEIPIKVSNSALVSAFMTELEPELPFKQFQYYHRNLSRQQAQQQAWLKKRRAENMARKAAREEPLPEEDPTNPIFKPIPEPSRVDSYLITNQISNYCNQINGAHCSMAAPASPLPSLKGVGSQNPNCSSISPSVLLSPSPLRLWRPAAQRNVRNQWSKLFSSKTQWAKTMSEGRSHATSLVNACLNRRYMSSVNLGAVTDMPKIREKAFQKLAHKQETYGNYLLSSHKNMVLTVAELVKSAHSIRCFLKGPIACPLAQFGDIPEHENDSGDGGGVPVFTFLSISHFEDLARELVEMFVSELSLKRFLVVEFLSLRCEGERQSKKIKWSDELYTGEFDDLTISGLCTENNIPPLFPQLRGQLPLSPLDTKEYHLLSSDVLQVYLMAWISDVNIDEYRIKEIFSNIEEETHIKFS